MQPYRIFRLHIVKHGWNEGGREGVGGPPGVCEGSENFALFWTVRSPPSWPAKTFDLTRT